MKRFCLFLGLCALLVAKASTAAADSATYTIDAIGIHATGTLILAVKEAIPGNVCGDGGKRFKVAANDPRYAAIQAMWMAAMLANRKVFVSYDPKQCVDSGVALSYLLVLQDK